MEAKAVSGIMLTLLLTSMLTLAFNIQPVEASGTIYIRSDGSVEPDTAPLSTVDNVTYTFTDNIYDSIVVERDSIVVDGAGYTLQGTGAVASKGIYLSERSNVTIKNIKIKAFHYGIRLEVSSNNTVCGSNITNNSYGIWLEYSSNYNSIYGNNIYGNRFVGIELRYSSNYNGISGNNIRAHDWMGIWLEHSASGNSISENDISASKIFGITLGYSSNNNISGNNLIDNYYGIGLDGSSNNILRGNIMTNNKHNFRVLGLYGLLDFINDVDVSNTVDGKPIYYWVNKRDMTVPFDAGYVALVNCTGITIQNLNFTNNGQGALLAYTTNSAITKNNITNNQYGIHFVYSSSNLISGNIITNNRRGILFELSSNNDNVIASNIVSNNSVAVWLEASSNNKLYHNDFIENIDQVYVSGSMNIWDDCYPSGGNYWSDYWDVDLYSGSYQNETGSDGIWDHPYTIDANNKDRYPFVEPWTPTPGDVNGDGKVDASDLVDLSEAYGSKLVNDNWNYRCDFNLDGKVDALDLFDLSKNYGKTV